LQDFGSGFPVGRAVNVGFDDFLAKSENE